LFLKFVFNLFCPVNISGQFFLEFIYVRVYL